MDIDLWIYGFMDVYKSLRVDISVVVMCDTSDVIKYD